MSSVKSIDDLESLKPSELETLAKKHGISTSQSCLKIINELKICLFSNFSSSKRTRICGHIITFTNSNNKNI